MGNAPDKTGDKIFMTRHAALLGEFISEEEPLYHVEDIKFPLSTDNMKIVDETGRRVHLAGGNWSGGHMCRHCVDGLQCRPMKDIAMDIRFKFKMNCIRLTYSLQLIFDNNVVPAKYLKANPELIGKTSMQIFDITVKTLTEVGLMVILNNHTSTSQWCCSNDDGDGLWWSRQYPQYLFFQHVRDFARRYKDNQRVIGMDMRNQIRKANGLEPSWGDGNPKTDWKRAAEISSQIALKQAPHWLILIGGINYQLDLSGVKQNPIILSVPNKLVYSGHFYGFSWPIPSWQLVSYDSFKKKLFNSQTYVRALGVPFLLGEFGNNNQDIPWKYLMQYLKQTGIDWTYWALDGFKCEPEKDQTYGVFLNDFSGARHPQMLQDMIAVGPPPEALKNYWSYLPGKCQKKPSVPQKKQPQQPPLLNLHQNKPQLLSKPNQVAQEQISDQIPINQIKDMKKQSSINQASQKKKQYFEQLQQQMRGTATINTQPQTTNQTPQTNYQQPNYPNNSPYSVNTYANNQPQQTYQNNAPYSTSTFPNNQQNNQQYPYQNYPTNSNMQYNPQNTNTYAQGYNNQPPQYSNNNNNGNNNNGNFSNTSNNNNYGQPNTRFTLDDGNNNMGYSFVQKNNQNNQRN